MAGHSNLYVVGATVIPILLLTGTHQANMYRRYLLDAARPLTPKAHIRRRVPKWQLVVAKAMAFVFVLIAVIAEWAAVDALSTGSDTPGLRSTVVWAILIMAIFVGIALVGDLFAGMNEVEAEVRGSTGLGQN